MTATTGGAARDGRCATGTVTGIATGIVTTFQPTDDRCHIHSYALCLQKLAPMISVRSGSNDPYLT